MDTPFLFVVGATHRTAPFEFRERVALSAEAEVNFIRGLVANEALPEFVILSTCNRVEIYGVASSSRVPQQVAEQFCDHQKVDYKEFGVFGFEYSGPEAVQHLMEVAGGLDSQVIGENEILGQVKRAYATAQGRSTVGPILNRLFQKAFQAAKHVRTRTAISTGQVSVANLAVDLAVNIFGSLKGTRVLLVGAGAMGEKSGKAFVSRGASDLCVCSRTLESAEELAAKLGASTLPFSERESRLDAWDVIVCSTSASGTVVSAGAVRDAMKRRPARPLLFVDLAMPRDVDAAVARESSVFLYNLEDLARVTDQNRGARMAEAERARAILSPRARDLWEHLRLRMIEGDAHEDIPSRDAPAPAKGVHAAAFV